MLEAEPESGLCVRDRLDRDASFVEAHNFSGKTQADTGPFFLGGKEGGKDLLHDFLVDAGSVVGDSNHGSSPVIEIRAEDNSPVTIFLRTIQRLNGVQNQIDEHLLDQFPVGREFETFRVDPCGQLYSLLLKLALQKLAGAVKTFRRRRKC